jgi:hypothetical protein
MSNERPNKKQLFEARDEFRALLATSGTPESKFQHLFTRHPYILSNSLPLRLEPVDILPQGRPGKAEVDFLFYPRESRSAHFYGSIEIKRPDTAILKKPRKGIITLTSDATTALAQAKKYATDLGHNLKRSNRPLIAMGNEEYLFLILGMQAELNEKVDSQELRQQFNGLLPPTCRLFPYDTLLTLFENTIPPRVVSTLSPAGDYKPHTTQCRIPVFENSLYWNLCAMDCAEHAYKENFPSRRGIYPCIVTENGEAVLCVYNNNPYEGYPTVRDEETEKFRRWLRESNIKELSYATFPDQGESVGYTYAMLLDIAEEDTERQMAVRRAMESFVRESFDYMERNSS